MLVLRGVYSNYRTVFRLRNAKPVSMCGRVCLRDSMPPQNTERRKRWRRGVVGLPAARWWAVRVYGESAVQAALLVNAVTFSTAVNKSASQPH